MSWFTGFTAGWHDVNGIRLFARTGGKADGPPVLLLHGFPQTHAMWHRVAQALAARYRLVLADLRGYGDSDKPPPEPDHAQQSKRVMAADLIALMRALGHPRFAVVGHDRGGRVAHRLALDHAGALDKLVVIDIAPTLDMYSATDLRFATAYYHWFFLLQPAPFPETLINNSLKTYIGRGEGEPFAEFLRAFDNPATVHAMCEDYRAGASIDLEHDEADMKSGRKIACPLLVLWGEKGNVGKMFDVMTIWRERASTTVRGRSMPSGHNIQLDASEQLLTELRGFLRG